MSMTIRRAILKRTLMGVALGLAVAGILFCIIEHRRVAAQRMPGPILSDCDGALRELALHYTPEGQAITLDAYREFLRQLPAGVVVHVVCPRQEDYREFVEKIGSVACALEPVVTGHAMTSWSRDRWLAMGGETETALLCPAEEQGASVWPAREGDQRVANDIGMAVRGVRAIRSRLLFDGGDFAADSKTVFVAPMVAKRNIGGAVRTAAELVSELESHLGRRVVLLENAPPHHVAMYMIPAGDNTVLVGDPAAGERLIKDAGPAARELCAVGRDFTPETQAKFDAVARQCQSLGYTVRRIPVVPGADGRTYLTYVNVIIDDRGGRRVVYMPIYRGADALNAAAAQVWRAAGYEVRTVDCSAVYQHFGVLHCLVNVLRR